MQKVLDMHAAISAPNRFEKWDVATLACIEVGGLIARLIGIGSSLNSDEILSLEAANGSWRDTLRFAMADRTHPPMHLFLLHIWTRIFGSSEVAARSLSVLFSLLSLFLVWKIARQYFSFNAAVIASAIYAFSPFFIHFGIQSRPYSLIALLSILSLDRMLAWVRNPQRSLLAVLFIAAGTCLILAQYPGAVFVCAEIAILIFFYRFPIATALLFPIILFPGAAWYVVSKTLYTTRIADLIGWIEKPTITDLLTLPCPFLGWINLRHALILLYILVFLSFCGLISRFASQNEDTKKLALSLVVLSLSVPISLYVLSTISGISYWADRQMIGSGTAIILLIAAGVSFLPAKMCDATFVLLAGWTILASTLDNPAVMGPAWKEIAANIQEKYPGRPLVVNEKWCADALEYYTKRTAERSGAVTETALNESAVFVCRPLDCSYIVQDPRLKKVLIYDLSNPSSASTIWVFDEK